MELPSTSCLHQCCPQVEEERLVVLSAQLWVGEGREQDRACLGHDAGCSWGLQERLREREEVVCNNKQRGSREEGVE